MKELLYYNELYDLYSSLLTKRQREYFEDYYFENLSLSEMAENFDVSRNAIFKQLKITKEKLDQLETSLHLYKKKEKLLKIINTIDDKNLKKKLEDLI